ncbi:MAG TPA: right-handed parallel beta-helix repeat-containing protein, partial [Phycisphaerales bacterium]|nr:right-handed parallel beta-helix repeat-containing protein [Phycisphaerales bacterium]
MIKPLLCVLGLMFLSVASSHAEAIPQKVFYVSPHGSDRNPGSETAPFKSIEFAQQAVRKALSEDQAAKITVYLRQGLYRLDETLVFDLRDSARDGGRIVYSGFPNETAIISAGLPITNWAPLEKPIPGLPDKARDSVWVASLPGDIPRFNTLYAGERRLPRARTKGFVPTVPRSKADKYTLHVPSGAIENWANSDDADIRIIPGRPWVLNYVPVVSAEPERNLLRTDVPVTYQMASPGFGKFDESAWIENLFEALDQPGEWILDYNQRRLYYWPENGTPGDDIVAPLLTELLRVEGQIDYERPKDTPVRNLVFQNLTFTHNDRMTWQPTKTGWGIQ